MPSRNITKEPAPDSYYHVYARGNNKQVIFIDNVDYKYFIELLKRYLSDELIIGKSGTIYPNFINRIELIAYCLMANHFHLLIYQFEMMDMEKFMRSLMTSYSRYLNLKYKRTGSVFESRYKAARVNQDDYLQHITRYIHLNPDKWETYKYSSLKYYRDGNEPSWLKNTKVLELFTSRDAYMDFTADYKELHDEFKNIKHELAD